MSVAGRPRLPVTATYFLNRTSFNNPTKWCWATWNRKDKPLLTARVPNSVTRPNDGGLGRATCGWRSPPQSPARSSTRSGPSPAGEKPAAAFHAPCHPLKPQHPPKASFFFFLSLPTTLASPHHCRWDGQSQPVVLWWGRNSGQVGRAASADAFSAHLIEPCAKPPTIARPPVPPLQNPRQTNGWSRRTSRRADPPSALELVHEPAFVPSGGRALRPPIQHTTFAIRRTVDPSGGCLTCRKLFRRTPPTHASVRWRKVTTRHTGQGEEGREKS